MPSPSKSAKDSASSKNGAAWPDMTQAGAGLETEIAADDPMSAPIEKLQPQPFSLKREVKKHPGLYFSLGALAVTGIAVFLGRNMIAKAARPLVIRGVKPVLIRAASRRPLQTAKLAAKHPKTAARLAAIFARDFGDRSARTAAGFAKDLGDRLPRRGRA